jgi:hypothetical protein
MGTPWSDDNVQVHTPQHATRCMASRPPKDGMTIVHNGQRSTVNDRISETHSHNTKVRRAPVHKANPHNECILPLSTRSKCNFPLNAP